MTIPTAANRSGVSPVVLLHERGTLSVLATVATGSAQPDNRYRARSEDHQAAHATSASGGFMMSRDRFRDYSAPMTALEVVTLIIAQARYGLSVEQARFVEDLLHGKQRRLASGLTGYYVQDIEGAIREMERS